MTMTVIQQEVTLSLRQIDCGRLTAEQEREIGWRIVRDNDSAAREQLIHSNLRLVVHIAKQFKNRGLSLSELIAEGNLGLVRAVGSFDPEPGIRFSTYGAWWMKQPIKRALINASQPLHIPAYMAGRIVLWKRVTRKLQKSLGREPSITEISELMCLSASKIRLIANAARTLRQSTYTSTGGAERRLMLVQTLHDPRISSPEELASNADDLQTIRRLLHHIPPREATVLRMRFGLDGFEPMTLRKIGTRLGLTRESIRLIKAKALRTLKEHLEIGKPLSDLKDEPKTCSLRGQQ